MSAKRRKRTKKSTAKPNLTQTRPLETLDLAQSNEARPTPTPAVPSPAKRTASQPSPKRDRATAIREADARQARFVAGVAALAFAVGVVFFFAGKASRRLDPPPRPGAATIPTPQKLADAVAAEVEKARSNATRRREIIETSVKTAPSVADATAPTAVNVDAKTAADATVPSAETLAFVVELNSASKAELTNLPRVGETLAERIIERREELGGFRSVDDLLGVKGIGEKTLDKMRPFCVVAPLDDAE
ncbi:MAG: helix-hairpin-helix domain-containing protein [Thermoguttaceae bacterium]|nr:helix-hairpin-helix domain-containing protein [Thermoguttaceae bacterium]